MEEKIITTEQVAETAEEIIVAADSGNWLKTAGKVGVVAATVVGAGLAIYKAIELIKTKKQQNAEASESDQVEEVDSTESDAE